MHNTTWFRIKAISRIASQNIPFTRNIDWRPYHIEVLKTNKVCQRVAVEKRLRMIHKIHLESDLIEERRKQFSAMREWKY